MSPGDPPGTRSATRYISRFGHKRVGAVRVEELLWVFEVDLKHKAFSGVSRDSPKSLLKPLKTQAKPPVGSVYNMAHP